jgi:hypothetical protein
MSRKQRKAPKQRRERRRENGEEEEILVEDHMIFRSKVIQTFFIISRRHAVCVCLWERVGASQSSHILLTSTHTLTFD